MKIKAIVEFEVDPKAYESQHPRLIVNIVKIKLARKLASLWPSFHDACFFIKVEEVK